MGKGDPKKPRRKMSLYAFFVQTCREEHKKKHPDASVNFSEFSKKCSERGDQKEVQGPQCAQDASFSLLLVLFGVSPKIKGGHPGLSIGDVAKKLGEMWNNTAADDKQPYEKKAAKLKEKYQKDIAAYRAKGKPDAAKKGVVKAEKSKKKKEEEDDEEDEEDEEQEEEEEDEDEEEDDDDE
ncbi:high mobility group protein B1 [Sigmodon hispidus]